MDSYQFEFHKIAPDVSDMLVAQLSEIGFDGFEEIENGLKALVLVNNFDDTLFDSIIDINNVKYTKSIIKEQNWNEKWESEFEPIAVRNVLNEKFAYLRADFHKADLSFKFDIIVTPKMSFGTGHHPTTYLMVQQMYEIEFENKSVVDFGTGTGVLAILASKMGTSDVLGIDNDEWSINNAKENCIVNGCNNIMIEQMDTITAVDKFDIVLANINLNIIKQNIFAIKNSAKKNATFLFSGIMQHDQSAIIDALKNADFNINNIKTKDGWLAISANKL